MVNKYNNIYNKKLNINYDMIIEAFVKYYGEKYRDRITYRLGNIIFCWFNHRYLNIFYEKYGEYVTYKDDIKNFLKHDINKIIGSNISNNVLSYIKENIEEALNNNKYALALNVTLSLNNDFFEVVAIPLFLCTDRVLFHELNHVICRNMLGIINECVFVKDGLDIDKGKYSILEEIVNDLSSKDITCIFNLLGGNIFKTNYKIGNDYEIMYPFVLPFYNKYKDLLKEVRITCNYNLLYKYINMDIYEEYVSFIKKKYYDYINCYNHNKDFVISDNDLDIVNNYVNNMDISNKKRLFKLV